MAAMAVMTVSRASVSFGQSPDLPHPLAAVWDAWKAAYMEPNGRVVDLMQGGASHSESQGYGLLLAATMQDAAAFDAITRTLHYPPHVLGTHFGIWVSPFDDGSQFAYAYYLVSQEFS
jgi:hypothetical protein